MKKGNSIKEKILMAIFYIVIALLVVDGIALICCTIWANIHYANVPVGEIPVWVTWLLFLGWV